MARDSSTRPPKERRIKVPPRNLVDAVIGERSKAHRDYETHIANAWRSEFQQQLALGVSYFPSSKPRTPEDRRAVVELIELLKKLLRGAPLGRRRLLGKDHSTEIPMADFMRMAIPAAEYAAAQRVRERKQLWREKNARPSVPPSVTAQMIADEIKVFAAAYKVPAAKISVDNVGASANKTSRKIRR